MDDKPGPSKENEPPAKKTEPRRLSESGTRTPDTLTSVNPDSVGSASQVVPADVPRQVEQRIRTVEYSQTPPGSQTHDMRGTSPTTSRGVFGRISMKALSRGELSRDQSLIRKKKKKINPEERKFISPLRAMEEYCLDAEQLQGLPTVQRRSPYRSAPRMTVYNRSDVEAKAIQYWGTKEKIEEEFQRRLNDKHAVLLFPAKKKLREMRREDITRTDEKRNKGLCSRSGFVVLSAITVNALNLIFKMIAWLHTDSHSMFSETLHSVADTANQIILAIGIYKSTKIANPDHPYGYTSMRYVSSLISGVGIFCIGSGLSLYHGVVGLLSDTPIEEFFWAYLILLFAVVSETLTLVFAIHAINKHAKKIKMSMFEYVVRGVDPSVNVVLLEDSAAVTGIVIAAICMFVSQKISSGIPDSVGSLLVGMLLGWVAWFIIRSNVGTLIGKSIPYEKIVEINNFLEKDAMIRAIYDVKGIDMGNNLIKYKAELDFDGRLLTKSYLDRSNIQEILEEMKKVQCIEDAEVFILKHGEQIVDTIGAEIDRIEVELRKRFPTIRHCDLEIL